MKELSFEKMEEVNGGWSDEDTVATICTIGPIFFSWVPLFGLALDTACLVTGLCQIYYAATR